LIELVRTRPVSRRAEVLAKVALACLSPLLLLGALEGIAFVWERNLANGPYAWELVASRRMVWVTYPEPGAGYTLMAPGRHYEWQDIPVDINAQGLRGPATPYEKPAGTYRILNLGDSVAMGWGVREEDTYGRRLEAWLTEHATGARRYEVINAGVPGWNLDNALAYLEAEGLRYAPDLVLLDITLVNDINGGSAVAADDRARPIAWLRDNTHFWPFLTSQLTWAKARAQGRTRIDVIDPPTNPAKYFPLDPAAERWTERWNTVLAIQDQARQRGAGFLIVLFPLEFQVLDETFPTVPQDAFTTRARAAEIPVVDLLPAFRQACQSKPGGACYREDRYLFADVWMHPSALGHQLTADALTRVVPDF
jgi:hypothetical protein